MGTKTKGRYSGDVGIWVGGETPYAEGRGDSSTLAFGTDDSAQLSDLCARVTVCIAILYSGRPLIITDQLSKADAFIAGWLPGTEAAGITDALFGGGFTGDAADKLAIRGHRRTHQLRRRQDRPVPAAIWTHLVLARTRDLAVRALTCTFFDHAEPRS